MKYGSESSAWASRSMACGILQNGTPTLAELETFANKHPARVVASALQNQPDMTDLQKDEVRRRAEQHTKNELDAIKGAKLRGKALSNHISRLLTIRKAGYFKEGREQTLKLEWERLNASGVVSALLSSISCACGANSV